MKQENSHLPYWKTADHLFGCYGAIIFCLLAFVNIMPLGWFGCSVLGYALGRLIYFVLQQLHTQPIYRPTTPAKNITPQPTRLVKSITQESISPEQKLLNDFLKLQFQVHDLFTAQANTKFQDIHALIIVLVQKFKRSPDQATKNEILNIQKIINNYLEPTIHNYQELPVLFLDRKMNHEYSPNELMEQQLDLIHHELLEISQYIFQNDFDRLAMHGEFLKQKLKPPVFFKVGQELSAQQDT
ncbi:hypothetical protein ACFODO_07150 [Acinetobacter sichuanensis]|uniref:Uncharacterized protein n=1 Tax=Acinetobacter sichuanensis TaxID=2136183 RepID=A0A371YR89_9GAMM|nr:hypothetical protein [Acinetobacter sichuanensis]RFC83962.1 hypothetical protein C9E89_008185 [Acinetobacter sichuanensis]